MPEARIGKAIHTAMEHALLGRQLFDAIERARGTLITAHEQTRFDAILPGVQVFVDEVDVFRRRRHVNRQLVELPLAIREDLGSTSFYAKDAFYRGILDAAFVFDNSHLAVIDHKTGQRSERRSVHEQLEGYAVLTAAYFQRIEHVWLGIYWVSATHLDWAKPVHTSHVRHVFVANVMRNIEAAALAVDDGPRPNTGSWCERCSYRSVCPEGKRVRFEPVEPERDDFDL